MEVRLRPELEALIRQDVERGAYQNVDEYVEHAVSMLHQQEVWLAAHHAEVEAQIDLGYAAAQRGELLEPDEVRTRLNELKQASLGKQQRGGADISSRLKRQMIFSISGRS
jgi:putative addiction module CopG family antidote